MNKNEVEKRSYIFSADNTDVCDDEADDKGVDEAVLKWSSWA